MLRKDRKIPISQFPNYKGPDYYSKIHLPRYEKEYDYGSYLSTLYRGGIDPTLFDDEDPDMQKFLLVEAYQGISQELQGDIERMLPESMMSNLYPLHVNDHVPKQIRTVPTPLSLLFRKGDNFVETTKPLISTTSAKSLLNQLAVKKLADARPPGLPVPPRFLPPGGGLLPGPPGGDVVRIEPDIPVSFPIQQVPDGRFPPQPPAPPPHPFSVFEPGIPGIETARPVPIPVPRPRPGLQQPPLPVPEPEEEEIPEVIPELTTQLPVYPPQVPVDFDVDDVAAKVYGDIIPPWENAAGDDIVINPVRNPTRIMSGDELVEDVAKIPTVPKPKVDPALGNFFELTHIILEGIVGEQIDARTVGKYTGTAFKGPSDISDAKYDPVRGEVMETALPDSLDPFVQQVAKTSTDFFNDAVRDRPTEI